MIKLLCIISLLSGSPEDSVQCDSVYEYVDTKAEPVGGMRVLMDSVMSKGSNLTFENTDNLCSRVYVEFTVSSNGQTKDYRLLRSCGDPFDRWVIHDVIPILKRIQWKPAMVNGEVVCSRAILPIHIHLK